LAEEKKPSLEEEVANHEFTKLVKESMNPQLKTDAEHLVHDLKYQNFVHFYDKLKATEDLSGKSNAEKVQLVREKTQYKASNDAEAELLADEIGVRTLKDVAGKQAKVYEEVVNKKKEGKELSKEEVDALEFSREALGLYKLNWMSIKRSGLDNGFTSELVEQVADIAQKGTLKDRAERYLRQIDDKEKMADYIVKAAKVNSKVDIDENKIRLKEFDEMHMMIQEVNQAPDQFKLKYKDLIKNP
jgi:hypothetical protein